MRKQAEFYLFLTTFIWASTFVAMKIAMFEVTPLLLTASRFALACAIVLPIWRRDILELTLAAFKKGLILGLLLSVGFIVQTYGLQRTTASKTAFITGMLVVFTPIAQIAIEKRPPKLGNVIGIVFVIVGLWFLTSPEGSEFNLGDGLTLIAAMVFGLYIVYLDIFTKEHNVAQLFFLQLLVTFAASSLGAVLFESFSFHPTTNVLLLIVYLSVFATVIATFVQTKFQKETTPTRAALIFSLEPVIAATLAYIVLDERLGWLGALGGVIIIAGVLISEFSDSFKKFLVWNRLESEEVE
jgi:drug/metabolite transporter (DMT)-like permease